MAKQSIHIGKEPTASPAPSKGGAQSNKAGITGNGAPSNSVPVEDKKTSEESSVTKRN